MAKLKNFTIVKVGEMWIELKNEETIKEFLARGGKITYCKLMEHTDAKFSKFGYTPINGRRLKKPWSDELSDSVEHWKGGSYDAFSN